MIYTLTPHDVRRMRGRLRAHVRLPGGDHMCDYQLIECPRLQFVDLVAANGELIGRRWKADHFDIGAGAAGLAAALLVLREPPILTGAEVEALASVPYGWTSTAQLIAADVSVEALRALRDKGVIEWRRICRDIDRSTNPDLWDNQVRRERRRT